MVSVAGSGERRKVRWEQGVACRCMQEEPWVATWKEHCGENKYGKTGEGQVRRKKAGNVWQVAGGSR